MNRNIFGPGGIDAEALFDLIRDAGGITTRPGIALHAACETLESAGRVRRTDAGNGKSLWQAPDDRGVLPYQGKNRLIARTGTKVSAGEVRKRIEGISKETSLAELAALYFLISEGVVNVDDEIVEQVRILIYRALMDEPGNALSAMSAEPSRAGLQAELRQFFSK